MKIKLHILLVTIIMATSVGWAQTSTITHYTIGGSQGGNGTESSPYQKSSLSEVLTAINASQEDSTVIYLPDGNYSTTDPSFFSITKPSVAVIGKDTNSVTIGSPFDITLAAGGAVSFYGVHLNATTDKGRGVVDIKSSNTTVSFTDSKVTISGIGTADGGSTVCFGIVSGTGEINNNTINFLNSRMFMPNRCQRGIAFRDGNGHTLNFSHSVMEGPAAKSGHDYVIGLCSWPSGTQNVKPITYNISDSRVDICYYAVFVNNQTVVPIDINIDNSDLTAWSSLYLRGDGVKTTPYSFPQTINITNSNLTGRSFMNGPSDGFSTIVFEACPNIDMAIDSKSTVISKHLDPQQVPAITMDLIQMRNTQGNITFTSEGNEKCTIQALNTAYSPIAFNISDNNEYKKPATDVKISGIENTIITNGDGIPYISIFKSDSSFHNAVADITTLLTRISITDGDKLVFPESSFELPTTFTLNKSLTIQGAGKDKTIIKGHIEVNPSVNTKATLTASDLTLEGNTNSSKHGIVGIIGQGTGKVELTNCKISGGELKGQTAAVGVRMESVGAELSMTNTDIDAYYYGIGVRNTEQKVTIDGGTIEGWAALMTSAGGLSSSDGALASTNTVIEISNATLNAATISNEPYGAVVLQEKYNGVKLSIKNCEITATDKRNTEHAEGVKMLSALDLRSYGNTITVEGGTLSSLYGENASGGAVVSLGYSGSGDESALANNTITINSDLKGKEGESLVYSNRTGEAKKYDNLTINGTDYSVASGLICYGAPITSGATLEQAIAGATDGEVISVSRDIILEKPLVINKAITLTSTNKSTIKGHLVIEAEGVTVKGLKFECNSTGYKYNEKNAVSVFANQVTLTGNEFTQADNIGNSYVTNGIVLYPQGQGEVSASYIVTGNTFKGLVKKAGTATSTPVIIRENFSDKGQLGDKGTTAALTGFTEDATIAMQNSFEQCAGGESYVRIKGNKYVYASLYSEDGNKGITDALASTDAASILYIKDLKAEGLAKLITGNLPELAYAECSDALVVTDKEKAGSLPASSKPIALLQKGTEGAATVEYITQIPVVNPSKLTASGVDAGKTISTSILQGGSATVEGQTIAGTFAWEHPDTIASTATKNYNVVFTPADQTRYGKVTVSVPVVVTQYWMVTAGICNHGKITIRNANAGNRYVDGITLTLDYTPDAHYKVSASAPKTMKVTENKELTATFEQIKRKVTITKPTGGSLKVVDGDKEVKTGESVADGTVLKVIATPETTGGAGNGYKLLSLTAGNNPVSNNAVTVNSDVAIAATFDPLPASEYTVGFNSDIEHGKLTMMDGNNNVVNAGASVKAGTKLTVIAIPDKGYKLSGGISATGSSISENACTVNANTTFSATFEQIKYEVSSVIVNNVSLVIKDQSSKVLTGDGLKGIPYGTVLTATATVTDDDYKLGSIVVNGKQITNGGEFTVTEATKIVVSAIEKATINFINLKQAVTYDGTGKQFVVQSIPAGLDGFSVSYEGISSGSLPVNAAENKGKEYKVTITRNADDIYKSVNITDASLTIEAAELKGVSAPAYGDGWTCAAGECSAEQVGSTAFYNVTVTPTDKNYKAVVFNLPQDTKDLQEVSLKELGLRSMNLKSTDASLTITATNGGVSLWNGAERLTTESTVYVGQQLTVKGEPDAGYSTLADWKINNVASVSAKETTIQLEKNNTIEVKFAVKSRLEGQDLPSVDQSSNVFTGNAIQPVIKLKDNSISWIILVKRGKTIVENPTDAATYDVWAQCSEQEQFEAFNGRIGSYIIKPQELKSSDIAVTGATPILKGQNIGLSELTGNASVEGTFKWSNPEQTADGSDVTSDAYPVVFTPASTNYTVASGVNLTQTIPFYASTKVAARKVTFADASNGTFIVKVNGAEVKSGAQITEGDKIVVETSPNTGYTASVSINNVAAREWTVTSEGDVTVVVTFNGNSSGGGEEPGVVVITGVSLEPSAKVLAIGEEFTLKASVKPAYADQSVTWSSSDETVATVKNGKVKALKTGKATITAMASDDEHYADCKITVSVPTGIDDLLAVSRVYGCVGCLVIEPAMPSEVMVTDMVGRILYHGRITDKTQLSATEGLYLVHLSDSGKAITVKVIVK